MVMSWWSRAVSEELQQHGVDIWRFTSISGAGHGIQNMVWWWILSTKAQPSALTASGGAPVGDLESGAFFDEDAEAWEKRQG